MKYVFLQHPTTGDVEFRAGFGLDCHHPTLGADLVRAGYVPTSAGYFCITADSRVETFGRSFSLNLDPHPDDARRIHAWHLAALKTFAAERAATA